MKNPPLARLTIAIFLLFQAATASAIDIQPGELRAPTPGLNLMQLSYQYSERGDSYRHGNKQPGDPQIVATQYQLRLGRAFEIAGQPAFFYAQTPTGNIQPQGALARQAGDSGLGDTALLLAIWPYANHDSQTYVALGAYLFAPTGSYDHKRSFNMGDNRYKSALQAAYQTPISANVHWMAALDAVWFGPNSDAGPSHARLEQQALYSAQTGLKYDLSPALSLAANYFYSSGGETRLNQLSRDDATRQQRYQLSATTNLPFGRLALQYGGDLKTDNGYYEKQRLIVRYSLLF